MCVQILSLYVGQFGNSSRTNLTSLLPRLTPLLLDVEAKTNGNQLIIDCYSEGQRIGEGITDVTIKSAFDLCDFFYFPLPS